MTGQQVWQSVCDDDTTMVSTCLARQDGQSFINYQDTCGDTPLYTTTGRGHVSDEKNQGNISSFFLGID